MLFSNAHGFALPDLSTVKIKTMEGTVLSVAVQMRQRYNAIAGTFETRFGKLTVKEKKLNF